MSLRLQNVNIIYDIDKDVPTIAVNNVSLNLNESGFVGIMGPSGSGKSSLLYTMAGLKAPTSGSVYYNNKNLTLLGENELANLRKREFGFIFQRHYLIDYMTVLENVLVPINSCKKEDKDKALKLLKKLDMDHLANKRINKISGGQRQRVAIARALINDPKIIFADELTSALDHKSASKVMDLLCEYKDKSLIIVVTHDKSILKNADEIINIWDGEVVSIEAGSENI